MFITFCKMSLVWKYFQKKSSKDISMCKLCFKTIKTSGNTSNLLKHLKGHHANIANDIITRKTRTSHSTPTPQKNVRQTKLVPDIQDTCSTAVVCSSSVTSEVISLDQENHNRNQETISGPPEPPQALPNSITRAFELAKSMKTGGSRHAAITNAILYYICVDYKPFHTVKGKGFQKLLKQLAPQYPIPSDTHIKQLMSDRYSILKSALKDKLHRFESFCITCDIWTETMNMTAFLGVTVHYLEGEILKSACLATMELKERHTGEYIAAKLSEVLEDWMIDKTKIMAILTDNGANIVSAVKILFENNTKKHLPCFAHTINLVAEKVISEGETSVFIEKIRTIVKYFKKSVLASDALKKSQSQASRITPKKMILDVKTRWNSCFYMLDRFVELAPFISPILLRDSNAPPMLLATELDHVKELITILKPLEFITRELSGEQYITLSKVIPLMNCLMKQISDCKVNAPVCVAAKDVLDQQIQRRFGTIEHISIIAISTLLDPRFKNLHFTKPDACAKAVSLLRKSLSEHSSYNSSGTESDGANTAGEFDFWQHHRELVEKGRQIAGGRHDDELSLYLKNPTTTLKSNPIETWEDMKEVFPGLYSQFRQHAVIVATSVPSERLFSKAGQTITQARNRLASKRLQELLFLAERPEEEWFD